MIFHLYHPLSCFLSEGSGFEEAALKKKIASGDRKLRLFCRCLGSRKLPSLVLYGTVLSCLVSLSNLNPVPIPFRPRLVISRNLQGIRTYEDLWSSG